MLIFYGWRGKAITGNMVRNHTCSECGQGSLRAHSIVQYFHLFWIPVFPFRKQVVTECMHCRHAAVGKDVPEAVRAAVKQQNAVGGVPKYLFTGTALIVLSVGSFFFTARSTRSQTDQMVASPMNGDYYVVDFKEVLGLNQGELRYGIFRVRAMDADSIAFEVGSYGYEYHSDAGKAVTKGDIFEQGYFMDGELRLSRSDVGSLYEQDYVKRVIRKE